MACSVGLGGGNRLRRDTRRLLQLGKVLKQVDLLNLANHVVIGARDRCIGGCNTNRHALGERTIAGPHIFRNCREDRSSQVLLNDLRIDDLSLVVAIDEDLHHLRREEQLLDLGQDTTSLIDHDQVCGRHDEDRSRELHGLECPGFHPVAAIHHDEVEDIRHSLHESTQTL